MDRSFVRTTLFATAGLLIWAADFLFIYVFAALACARGFAGSTLGGIGIVYWASAFSTILAVAATVVVGLRARCHRPPADASDAFRVRVACAVAALGFIAVGFTAMPGMLVKGVCA